MQDNRDKRVELLQQYAGRFFPSTRYLDYAVTVEQYTLTKAPNLVLNVDGCIGALFLDLLHSCRMFTEVRIFWSGCLLVCSGSWSPKADEGADGFVVDRGGGPASAGLFRGAEAREQMRELACILYITNTPPHTLSVSPSRCLS